MARLTSTMRMMMGWAMLGVATTALAQGSAGPGLPQAPGTPAPTRVPATPPLKLYSLDAATQADPFPPVNPKNFTADSPSVAAVEGYLKTMLGFDANRIWRVEAIQKTSAPGVSKVVVAVSERGAGSKVLTAMFFVMPDGRHMISNDGQGVTPFGEHPFAQTRALLQARADGPAVGAASKDLLLVEFADLQCPHCRDAQATMKNLERDFPGARIVYQAYPLVDVHPFAFEAASYGSCVAKQGAQAYATFAQAVYDNQAALLPDTAEATLKAAVVKAGADPAAIASCAAGEAAKSEVSRSMALAQEAGVDSTPTLVVNGRPLGMTQIPYETLKQLIAYQAGLDGVSAAAGGSGTIGLKP